MSVTRSDVDEVCGALPGATLAHPPELVSWKVGGKMFACFGGETDMQGVSLKTPDSDIAAMLIDTGAAIKAPYFHKSWVRLPFVNTDISEVTHRTAISYDIIRKSLPKATRDALQQCMEG